MILSRDLVYIFSLTYTRNAIISASSLNYDTEKILGECLLISNLPCKASRTLVESRVRGEACLKSCNISNRERVSCQTRACPARDVDYFMTSDVNKWRDITQNLRQSSVLLTFLYVKRVRIVNWNM